MKKSIDEAMQYAADHSGFRATLGIILTGEISESVLSWAAINEKTGEHWVPGMDDVRALHPQATWKPLSPTQLRLYLETSKDTAFIHRPTQQTA